jgi:hypothetical protein
MNNAGSIAISFSKKKIIKHLIVSIVFTALGCWVLFTPGEGSGLLSHPLVKNGAAIGSILLGSVGTLLFATRMLRKKAAILIDDDGITDHSSPVAAGHVPWSDVHVLTTTTVVNQRFLLLLVKNPERYIQRQKNLIAQKGMHWNFKTYGSPICIAASGLQCTLGELERLIEAKLSAYKRQGVAQPI